MTSEQTPLGSGFGPATTATEALDNADLHGRTAIVTGGYSGLGLETVRVLTGAGARVIVPARDRQKAEQALGGLAGVEILPMDLNKSESVADFAAAIVGRAEPVHLLVNAAGIMATPLSRDEEGHEGQWSTNHLGHFRLTCGLWPALVQAGGARLVSYSSRGHQIAPVDFDDIDFERRPYDKWVAYGQSKTANVLFALALDRRGREAGVRAFSLHPGTVLGPLARHLSAEEIARFNVHDAEGNVVVAPERDLKSAEQGAATGIWCAVSPLLEGKGGLYCEDCDVAPMAPEDGPGRYGVKAWAVDPEAAERLWAVSTRMTGLDLG